MVISAVLFYGYFLAEKLLGHKNGLDEVYFVPTVEQLFRVQEGHT
jgi:hypothetical protein